MLVLFLWGRLVLNRYLKRKKSHEHVSHIHKGWICLNTCQKIIKIGPSVQSYLHYKQTDVQTSRAGGSIVEIGNAVMHRLVKWQPQPESVAPSMSPHQSLCVKNIAPYLIMIHLYYDSLQTLTTSARGFWAAREEATFLCKLSCFSPFNSDKSLLGLLLIFFVTCYIHYVKLVFVCLRIFNSLFSNYFQHFSTL